MTITRNRLSALAAALMISAATLAAPFAVAQTAASAPAASTPAAAASAPAAAPAASLVDTPTPPPAPADHETVNNPYGLDALWKGGDFVARGTLIILVLMSM
ncbi:MAG TPA: MotA/TolQ/ExbB proton channel family protein, partial [Collimonas sp.]|nr:MotA/TolQ/ExbB proton channel family protein [Collimonas sp.]